MTQTQQNLDFNKTNRQQQAPRQDKVSDWALFLHPVFVVSTVLFGINQTLERVFHLFLFPLNAYLDDLVALPLSLTPVLWLYRKIYAHQKGIAFSLAQCLGAALYFSIAFEVVAVWLKPQAFTADWLDVGCYFIGAMIFYATINKKAALNH